MCNTKVIECSIYNYNTMVVFVYIAFSDRIFLAFRGVFAFAEVACIVNCHVWYLPSFLDYLDNTLEWVLYGCLHVGMVIIKLRLFGWET